MGIKTYQAAYGKDTKISLRFPESWTVETIKMTRPAITVEQIAEIIRHPLGTKPLAELAIGTKTVGIILEDHTRFTPLVEAVDIVLEDLLRAGVKQGCIKLIGASATHRVTKREDISRKISKSALQKVRVIEHAVFDESKLTYIGTTSRGTEVRIHSEIAECDLIVGIGGIAPHGSVQFGGGAKLLLPGIAGYETIRHNHTHIEQSLSFTGEGIRPMRQDMEEALDMVNYAFNISGFIDHDGKLVDMVAGDPVIAHRMGMEIGEELYYFPVGEKADVVVACSNPLDVDCFQSIKGLLPAVEFVKPGGTILWLSACPEGIGTHYLTQLDDDYRSAMIRGIQSCCDIANVLFCAGKMNRKELYRFIAGSVEYYENIDDAVFRVTSLAPQDATVKILWASPFTVGVEAI